MGRTLAPARRRLSCALPVLLVSAVALADGDSAGGLDAVVQKVDSIAAAALDSGDLVGLSIAVLKGDEAIFAKGFGFADLESLAEASPATRYYIGSITKTFTAAAILRLAERELLSLEDDVARHVPELATPGHPIRLRHLLNHTSGLAGPEQVAPRFVERRHLDFSRAELLRLLEDEPRIFTPGERYEYNNLGYVVLGIVVERVSGQEFEAYLQQNILGPAAGASVLMCDARRVIRHRARGYVVREGAPLHHEPVNASLVFAAGGLCATAPDLARWFRALAAGEVVSAASFEQMSTPATLEDGSRLSYGYGLFIDDPAGGRIHHGGIVNGFSGHAAYYADEEITVVVLTNTRSPASRIVEGQIAMSLMGSGG